MPSNRFHNLKRIKKRNFLIMAYKEFALHSFEGASITRLVANLKIAKGSIYQYFEDKKDLYNYLIEHAQIQFQELINKTFLVPPKSNDFDDWLKKNILIQVKFLLKMPSYALLFIRHQADFGSSKNLLLMQKDIEKASLITGKNLPPEDIYRLQNLPFLIFNFISLSEKNSFSQIINSNSSINISTEKLIFICDIFVKKS